VTPGACFNCRGDAPPPLLVCAGPQCALEELASVHGRSLWLGVNHAGWVDRVTFRQWRQWFPSWMVAMRALSGLGLEEPAIMVSDAPTQGSRGSAAIGCEPHSRRASAASPDSGHAASRCVPGEGT
jgi:hypothetical protein